MLHEITTPALITDIGPEPIVAAAIHDGHLLRRDLLTYMKLDPATRLREEDPFTAEWTKITATRIVGLRSRFEVDLNRPRDRAVYRTPEEAWGLDVWSRDCPEEAWTDSLETYDEFYRQVKILLDEMERRFGKFVVFDLHSYNHRRGGASAEPDSPEANPAINVGTGTMERERWGPVVDRLVHDLRRNELPDGPLDVRENVKFFGGNFSRWIHENFPFSGCSVAVEVKKFFMDEWTGEPFPDLMGAVRRALESAIPGVLEELRRL